jgi:hypothetical protein
MPVPVTGANAVVSVASVVSTAPAPSAAATSPREYELVGGDWRELPEAGAG